jgi:hypothetical protein
MPGEAQPEAPPPVPEAAPSAPIPEEPPAEETFKVTTGVGVRAALRIQDPSDPEKIGGDQWFDELYVEPRFSGKVTDVVGWTANFEASGNTTTGLNVRTLDLVAQLDFMDEFHIWMGRMLTPSDRSNFSGPWFIAPWTYPGVYPGVGYLGPRGTEELGRETGFVVWGDIMKGKFKYYLGAMDLDANNAADGAEAAFAQSPLLSARLGYAFIGSEPGFYSSSTYYGSQDIVALGAAVQYQKDFTGSAGNTGITDDLVEFNADALAEFNVAGTGTFGVEGAYYHFEGDSTFADDMFFVVATYLTPENVGIGKIGPVVRYQMAKNSDLDASVSQIEGGIAYVMKDYFAKLQLTYTHTDTSDVPGAPDDDGNLVGGGFKSNFLQLGFQIQQ